MTYSFPPSPLSPYPPSAPKDTNAYWQCPGFFHFCFLLWHTLTKLMSLLSWIRPAARSGIALALLACCLPEAQHCSAYFLLYFSLSMAKLLARELKAPFLAMPHLYNIVLLGCVWRRLLGCWKTRYTILRDWYVWGQIHDCACMLVGPRWHFSIPSHHTFNGDCD